MNFKHFTRLGEVAGLSAFGLGVGLALAACTPGTSSAAGPTSSPAASAVATPSASAPTVTAASPSATLVPMQTASGGEFLSPSGNISCEVDYHRAGRSEAYCQTVTPSRSVTMDVAGKYTSCTGQQCLGNPGTGTPTLAYGTATGVGPFRCESATTGITCVVDGKGFRISTSGVTPVSA